ncbi:hypothetical protein [Pseudomonas sp. Fl4BN1]|uniref:hypothetical protein n=1 Tax=Pseudomonas sp. Fl4BN1 TaxID=2697651 RepID=UPI001378C884|nr:hypothetical protein [Pseudomonas sp. Fl4BN1]NBF09171.1 hypothetical protein [Pseudomonas sp. Fl4BN1]
MPDAQRPTPAAQPEHLRAAASLRGQRLQALTHAQYLYNGQVLTDECGDLQFDGQDGSQVSLFLLADGESVGAAQMPMHLPAGFELEAGVRCAWEARDLLQRLAASHLRGAMIVQVQGLFDDWQELGRTFLCGFRICFDSGDFVVFYNQGDEAVALFNQLPPSIKGAHSLWRDLR